MDVVDDVDSRKSDVKRPAGTQGGSGGPTSPSPLQEDYAHELSYSVSLPPASDFRTSLILPRYVLLPPSPHLQTPLLTHEGCFALFSLSRRFTILRDSSGSPLSPHQVRERLAEQRLRGTANHITQEEEDMMIAQLEAMRGSVKSTTSSTNQHYNLGSSTRTVASANYFADSEPGPQTPPPRPRNFSDASTNTIGAGAGASPNKSLQGSLFGSNSARLRDEHQFRLASLASLASKTSDLSIHSSSGSGSSRRRGGAGEDGSLDGSTRTLDSVVRQRGGNPFTSASASVSAPLLTTEDNTDTDLSASLLSAFPSTPPPPAFPSTPPPPPAPPPSSAPAVSQPHSLPAVPNSLPVIQYTPSGKEVTPALVRRASAALAQALRDLEREMGILQADVSPSPSPSSALGEYGQDREDREGREDREYGGQGEERDDDDTVLAPYIKLSNTGAGNAITSPVRVCHATFISFISRFSSRPRVWSLIVIVEASS